MTNYRRFSRKLSLSGIFSDFIVSRWCFRSPPGTTFCIINFVPSCDGKFRNLHPLVFTRSTIVNESTSYSPNEVIRDNVLGWRQIFDEASSRSVVRRSLIMAAIVGPILISINHVNCLVVGCFGWQCVSKSFLTLLVPYCVSTVSSVLAAMEKHRQQST